MAESRNKKNLWLFGDSFTNFTYQGVSPKYSDDIVQWGSIVSKKMGLNLVNLGEGGFSNQQIIAMILNHISKIEEGDYISIGLSAPTRTITVRNNMIRSFLPMDYAATKLGEDKYVYEYVSNILMPNSELVDNFYWEQVKGLEKLFEKMRCKTFLWNYKTWDKFETIKKQSKGKDKDPHWSKKGHEDMAKLVIQNFTNNKLEYI